MAKVNFNLIINFFNLIKILIIRKSIDWDSLSEKIIDSEIDKNCKINIPSTLKKVSIGKGTYISKNSSISYTSIGRFCSIGPNFICGWGIHPLTSLSTSPTFYSTAKQAGFTYVDKDLFDERKPISIGNDVFIGANVIILDGVTIGDGAVIGAGAVVNKDIPPYAIAVGSPIRVVKYRFQEDVIEKLLQFKWWEKNDDDLKKLTVDFFNVVEILKKNNL
jgi:acetyltransferase-like isoleucine patch superfamily enzyme